MRNRLAVFAAMGFGLALSFSSMQCTPRTKSEVSTPAALSNPFGMSNPSGPSSDFRMMPAPMELRGPLTPAERRLLASAERSLKQLATRSPLARQLAEFYSKYASPARYAGPGRFVVLDTLASDTAFFVVADTVDASPLPGKSAVVARYINDVRCLQISATAFNPLVQGLFMAHEIQHAYDHVILGEPPSPPLSDIWIAGEIRAHGTVYRVLNEYTRNRWKRLVEARADSRELLKHQRGASSRAFTFGIDSVDVATITAAFGDLTPNDLSALTTQLMVDVNMISIMRVAGTDSTMSANGMHEFMRTFYKQTMPSGLFIPQ